MIKKILIIGGSRFIGTRLAKRLAHNDGVSFSIADKVPSLNFPNKAIIADVRSIEQLRESVADNSIIINLAAEHRDDVRPSRLCDEVNVEGAINICTVARERNLIYAGSTTRFGEFVNIS